MGYGKKRKPRANIHKDTKKLIFEEDNYTCIYCGQKTAHPVCEHITPVSKGGTDNTCNLATSCFRCNQRKMTKSVDEWLKNPVENKGWIKRSDVFKRHEERRAKEQIYEKWLKI